MKPAAGYRGPLTYSSPEAVQTTGTVAPLKPEEALSQAQRQAANEWYDHTLYSRLNDKLTGAIVLIMHRLHEDDLAGHVLEQEPWEVVRLPALADEDEAYRVATVFGQQSFGRKEGEALHPA